MTLGDRLLKARNDQGHSQKELERISGVKQGLISKIERGDQNSTTFITQLAIALNVDHVWLATGKGQMRINSSASLSDNVTHRNQSAPIMQDILKLLNTMSSEDLEESYELIRAYQNIRKIKNTRSLPKSST